MSEREKTNQEFIRTKPTKSALENYKEQTIINYLRK